MSEELDTTVAEYVLGTLPAGERAAFAERIRDDAALRAEVLRLQARLAPLDDTASPELPREAVWREIERVTLGAPATAPAAPRSLAGDSSNVIELRRKL